MPRATVTGQVSATMESVTTERVFAREKWVVVDVLLATHDLLVIGYSGSDDFDVMPSILFARSTRRILWVQHSSDEPLLVWRVSDREVNTLRIGGKLDWFFRRMFGSFFKSGRVKWRAEDLLIAVANTESILDLMVPEAFTSIRNAPDHQSRASSWSFFCEWVRDLLQRQNAENCLFVGLVFYAIGFYDESLRYLGRALELSTRTTSPLITARSNATIARIWLDREDIQEAASYLGEALVHYGQAADWTKQDLFSLIRLSFWLGFGRTEPVIGAHLDRISPAERSHFLALLDRERRLWRARLALEFADHDGAFRHIAEILDDKTWPLEAEQQADLVFVTNQAVREVMESQRKRGDEYIYLRDQKGSVRDAQLEEVSDTYELLQRRLKWARAILFHSEDWMLSGYFDWAEEGAGVAHLVYSRIGNTQGAIQSLKLQAYVADRSGEKEQVEFYKNEIKELEERGLRGSLPGKYMHFMCPNCRRITHFRVKHCTACGWYSDCSPETPEDNNLTQIERSQVIETILSRVNRVEHLGD